MRASPSRLFCAQICRFSGESLCFLTVLLLYFWFLWVTLVSKESRWSNVTKGVNEIFTIHTYSGYYDILSKLFYSIDIWESSYVHIMESQYSILEMIRSTGLRPYLDRLDNEADKLEFEKKVLADIKIDYQVQENGKVLFPFKRLFFIAKN